MLQDQIQNTNHICLCRSDVRSESQHCFLWILKTMYSLREYEIVMVEPFNVSVCLVYTDAIDVGTLWMSWK